MKAINEPMRPPEGIHVQWCIVKKPERAAGCADKYGILTVTRGLICLEPTGGGAVGGLVGALVDCTVDAGYAASQGLVLDVLQIRGVRYDPKKCVVSIAMPTGKWLIVTTTKKTFWGRTAQGAFNSLRLSLSEALGARMVEHAFPRSAWDKIIIGIVVLWVVVAIVIVVAIATG